MVPVGIEEDKVAVVVDRDIPVDPVWPMEGITVMVRKVEVMHRVVTARVIERVK